MKSNKRIASLKNLVIIFIGMAIFLLFLALLIIAERFILGQV